MNPAKTIEHNIMDPKKLEGMMLKNQPIVPPDSVIKTFPNLKGTNIDLVITQDKEGLSQGSFIVRRGEWTKFFLDTWFDPLYRSYNFQKADTHALVGSECRFMKDND
jgi:mannan polymerase II complex MNN11 subunit